METFQKVLKKARDDGQIDPRILTVSETSTHFHGQQLQLPPQLLVLPEPVIRDLQKITENIRQTAESRQMQIIGFASAIPGQGTSTVTALLSLLMAAREKMNYDQLQSKSTPKDKQERQLGLLLIDGQIRHPSLHHKMGLDKRGGLIDILENEIPGSKAVKNVPHSPLRMVTAGTNNNFQLSQSHLQRLSHLLENAKKQVGFIFVDIPPLLTYSEGTSLSRLCDGVILVVQAGETRWEVIQEARRLLERTGVNLLGGVLNRREYLIPSWAYKNI